jgi:CDP-4-dehydro-6-deoxyglucose reductase/3-phenylpropionate/trans-cinnamate dioxygenase ferredoxin reductase subunit
MHTVLNLQTGVEVDALDNETIFDAFSRNGTELPHGCLAGTCAVCLVRIVSGDLEALNPPSELEQHTLQRVGPEDSGYRLSCRARVKGSITFTTL